MILIVDVHNMAHRAAHANKELWSSNSGQFTGLYYGVLSMLLKLADELKPDFVWMVSDPISSENKRIWRKDYLPTYKDRRTTRTPEQERMYQAIQMQLPEMKQALLNLNVWWFEQAGLEADDIIGHLRSQNENAPITCVSTDRDLFTLISPSFTVYYPGKPHRWLTHDNFFEMSAHFFSANKKLPSHAHTKLTLNQWSEYRWLTGDDSDLIPGLPKCGDKTALTIIQNHGSYGEYCKNIQTRILAGNRMNKTEVALASETAQRQFTLNAFLMKLNPPQSPIPFDPQNPLCRVGAANFQWLSQWMAYHEFSTGDRSLFERLKGSALCRPLSSPFDRMPRY